MKNWFWIALLSLTALNAVFATIDAYRHWQVREAIDPCLSGQQTVCELDGATITISGE